MAYCSEMTILLYFTDLLFENSLPFTKQGERRTAADTPYLPRTLPSVCGSNLPFSLLHVCREGCGVRSASSSLPASRPAPRAPLRCGTSAAIRLPRTEVPSLREGSRPLADATPTDTDSLNREIPGTASMSNTHKRLLPGKREMPHQGNYTNTHEPHTPHCAKGREYAVKVALHTAHSLTARSQGARQPRTILVFDPLSGDQDGAGLFVKCREYPTLPP